MTRRRGFGAAGGVAAAAALPVLFLGVFFLWPLASIVALGLAPGGQFDLSAMVEVLARPRTRRILGQTFGLAGAATVLAGLVGIPLAHVLYRRRFRGRALLRLAVLVPFVMPSVVVGFAFSSLLRDSGTLGFLGLDGTPTAVVLALAFFNVAVFARTVGAVAESLDSRMEDAARVLGASPAAVFVTVTLPRWMPAIASAATVVFLFCATAFGVVLVLGDGKVGTIETEIFVQATQYLDLSAASVLSLLQLVVVVVLVFIAGIFRQRNAERRAGVASVARAQRRDLPGVLFAILVAGALSLPTVALLLRSLDAPGGWGLQNYLALGTSGERSALRISVVEAVLNSLAVAAVGTVLATGLGVLVALALTRSPRERVRARLVSLLDHAVMLPLGVSAVTVGLGILITLDQPPVDLRASWIIVPIAQALVALPLVVRALVPVFAGVDQRMRDAVASMGASPWRTLLTVDLAIAARPILAAGAFAFAVCLGEFGATAFLSRPENATLPVVIYRLLGTPGDTNLGMAAAASVLLAVLTVGVMAVIERSRVGRAAAF